MKKGMIIFVVLVFIFSACQNNTKQNEGDTDFHNNNITDPRDDFEPTATPVPDFIEEILSRMTLEEKIGQLFIVAYRQDTQGNPVLSVDDQIINSLAEYTPGGVILFSENIKTIPQTETLIQELQNASKIPLFVAVDEEGGLVSRITKSPEMKATLFPNNAIIGQKGEPEIAARVAQAISTEIASLGFNMNFAPVADINTNPNNPVIGVRAYGSEPVLVGDMVAAAVSGFQSMPVSAVLKHFPGHGDTENDSHYGSAKVHHSRERLFKTELIPFIQGIEAGADGIMTAHILTPEIPGENIPATLKPEIITDILRNELKYDGLVITDALEMGAIAHHFNSGEAAVKAILAGVDLLLMPEDLEMAVKGVKEAHQSGEISAQRIHESVRRILETKHKRSLFSLDNNGGNPELILGCKEHQDLAAKILE